MADPRKLKDKAAELASKGKLDKAASLYREAADADPKDAATRQKLAEVLRRAGRTEEAIEAYCAVAERFAQDGLLIKAIAISKTILELDPEHVATQSALAALYARRAAAEGARPPARTVLVAAVRPPAPAAPSPRPPTDERLVAIPLGPVAPAPAPPPEAGASEPAAAPPAGVDAAEGLPPELVVEVEPPTAYGEIVLAADAAIEAGVEDEVALDPEPLDGVAIEIAGDEPLALPLPAAEPVAPALPRVPILSDLSRDAFVALTRAMALRRVEEGEAVLVEGEAGTTFYVVATGRLAVTRRDERGEVVVLARLGEGDFFGEMALLSGAPRSATVVAEVPSELLEFRAEVLLELARRHPHVAASLRRFYRQRLLANAMAVSPIFRPFGRGDRKLVMERFRARPVAAGETIVREGDPSDGLYVVLEGALDVLKRKDGATVPVARLREGDLFGEMSCLRKAPATATVVARRGGTLLRLPREGFDDLVVSYPQILELVSELSEERAESLDAILSGRAQWTDEGLVLV